MLLVWPFFMWLAYRSAGYDLTFWQAFRGRQPFLDSGPLWFVDLDVRSRSATPCGTGLDGVVASSRRPSVARISSPSLQALPTSFVVRLWAPARSQQIFDLHVWQLPQCVGMFCLGALLSAHGWARHVPSNIARRCAITVAITLVVAEAVAWGVKNVDRPARALSWAGGTGRLWCWPWWRQPSL